MSATVKIELTPSARKILANMPTLTPAMMQAIARGMDQANQLALRRIQQKHLTGVGPFPPAQHRLGIRSGDLLRSAWASKSVMDGDKIQSAIGSPAKKMALAIRRSTSLEAVFM